MRRQKQPCRSRNNVRTTSQLLVRCTSPVIHDPKELHTLVLFSLRHLFGDFESHSFGMIVEYGNIEEDVIDTNDFDNVDGTNIFSIRCTTESVPAIRASLTIVTPPPFLEDKLYQIDVLKVYSLPRSEQR